MSFSDSNGGNSDIEVVLINWEQNNLLYSKHWTLGHAAVNVSPVMGLTKVPLMQVIDNNA